MDITFTIECLQTLGFRYDDSGRTHSVLGKNCVNNYEFI